MAIQKNSESTQEKTEESTNGEKGSKSNAESIVSGPEFLKTASPSEIKARYTREISAILSKYTELQSQYCFVALMNADGRIGTFDLDQIFSTSSVRQVLRISFQKLELVRSL
jgi:exopolysaccharide biosynthesis protein